MYGEVKPIIRKLRGEGLSLGKMAERLNADGFTTLRGAAWSAMQVSRLLA
jgi:hypothetical protein